MDTVPKQSTRALRKGALVFYGGRGGGLFLGVAETIVGLLLCCIMGIVQCLFNLTSFLVIAPVRNNKKLPMGDSSAADMIRRRDTHAHDDYRYPWGRVLGALIFNSTWKLPGVTR